MANEPKFPNKDKQDQQKQRPDQDQLRQDKQKQGPLGNIQPGADRNKDKDSWKK